MKHLERIKKENREASALMARLMLEPYIAFQDELDDLLEELRTGKFPVMPFPMVPRQFLADIPWHIEEEIKVESWPGSSADEDVITIEQFLETADESYGYAVLENDPSSTHVVVGKFSPER